MIEIRDLRKTFDSGDKNGAVNALNGITLNIAESQVFGLIGTNGAGKSTMMRLIAGIYRPDEGEIIVDGMKIYDNPEAKKNIFFAADDPYFFQNATPNEMARYYSGIYEAFDKVRFNKLLENFNLDGKRKISTFSKGMKKQLSCILGVCSGTKYLFLDETFDGLDPVMRQAVKSLFANDMAERGLTPIIASHNLRELEDICDHVGLLHQGGVLLSEDIEEMKLGIQKVQCVFKNDEDEKKILEGADVMMDERRGKLHTITIRGNREEIEGRFNGYELTFFEVLPLTLEEVFISETEVVGYDIRKLILN
ncbi:MAG: ABC transporter ATP-binding protein [Lachnospiraceae bacterium]|nr:ABC transporter ATP-binding protein [Lachnospiraceae bacterium]